MNKIQNIIDNWIEKKKIVITDKNNTNVRKLIQLIIEEKINTLEEAKEILEYFNVPFNYENEKELVDIYLASLYIYIKHNIYEDNLTEDSGFDMSIKNHEKFEEVLKDVLDSWYNSKPGFTDTYSNFLYEVYYKLERDIDSDEDIYSIIYPKDETWETFRNYLENLEELEDTYYEIEAKNNPNKDDVITKYMTIDVYDFIKIVLLAFFDTYYKRASAKIDKSNLKAVKFRNVLEDAASDENKYYKLAFLGKLYVQPIHKINAFLNFYRPIFFVEDAKERTEGFVRFFKGIIRNLLDLEYDIHYSIQDLTDSEIESILRNMKIANDEAYNKVKV